MKKTIGFTVLFIFTVFSLVFAGEVIKGPTPDKLPLSEKCATCHNISHIYKELSQSGHKQLQCFDCHLPGKIQNIKYPWKDCNYYRFGYHEKEGNWIETTENEMCLRCHGATGIKKISEKCSSCHMAQEGVDKIIMVKDRALPPTPDNTKEVKEVPHKVHTFKYHLKSEIKK